MAKQVENITQYMPKPERELHAGIVAQISKQYGQPESALSQHAPSVPDLELSEYISRIQQASQMIGMHSARIRDLEDENYALKQQLGRTEGQLEDASQHAVKLEQELATERNRSARAEGVAASAVHRSRELEQALSAMNDKFDALTAAIDGAFEGTAGLQSGRRSAA